MPTTPAPARRPTRRGGEELLAVRSARLHGIDGDLAPAAREPESAVDERRAETPLRDEDPPARDERPSGRRPRRHHPPTTTNIVTIAVGGMRRDERDERPRDPQPPALDEEDVEQVILAREVRRRLRLHVRLSGRVVRRPARLGRQHREQRAEE